ncbi:MAG TPA: TlpA disulfide reductase family protein [Flavobacterium sp.]|nr:TlpA disulfide reductase family protein [Flavobacterium sp.]
MRSIVLILLMLTLNVFGQAEESAMTPKKIYNLNGVEVKSYDFINLQGYLNKKDETTYVINFWATWCLPCVKELPHFETLNKNYKDKGVKVILVSLDMPKKIETNLIPFIIKKKLQSEVIHLDDPDANAWIEKVAKEWSGSIPATVIYNKESHKFYERSFTYEELENELKTILK